MGRIDRSEGNLFPWPKGAYVRDVYPKYRSHIPPTKKTRPRKETALSVFALSGG